MTITGIPAARIADRLPSASGVPLGATRIQVRQNNRTSFHLALGAAPLGDEARTTVVCCISPGPVEKDDNAIAEADQEPEMREGPQKPGDEAGQPYPAEI